MRGVIHTPRFPLVCYYLNVDNKFLEAIEKRKLEVEKPKFRSERSELFNELYSYYEKSYRKNCWSDYITWLKKNKFKHSKEKIAEFKKSKDFRKKISIKSFCSFWLSFVKTNDLYYLISIAKDKDQRGENFNKWLFWAIKNQ